MARSDEPKKSKARSEASHLADPWDKLTLLSLMDRAAAEHPVRVFLRDCPHREQWNGVEPRELTSDAFAKGARFLAAQLKTLGIEPGGRILLLLPNIVEVPLAILACHLAGAVPAIAPIDERVDMLRAAAERANAAMILTTGRVGDIAIGEKARQIAAKVMHVRCVAGFGFDLPDGVVSLEGWSDEDILPLPELGRQQDADGLITFTRQNGSVDAALRTEGQLVAEALALGSVMRLDGRRGLISLMHPGSAVSIAASLTLPLYAGASVRLIGPYDSVALAGAFEAEPGAFLYCPDHFAAQLTASSLGPNRLKNHAGILALVRTGVPDATVLPPGVLGGSLVVDFDEAGVMTTMSWPKDGKLRLPQQFAHPMEGVLPEGSLMLEFQPDGKAEPGWAGFGAARMIRRADGHSKGKAA